MTDNKSLYICYIAAQNALGQPDCMIISNTSLEQSDEIFFPCWYTNPWKLKTGWKILWWVESKMCVVTLVPGLLSWFYLKIKLMKYTNFLHGDINLGKLKFTMIFIEWDSSKMGMDFSVVVPYLMTQYMNWDNFLHANTNSGKPNFNFWVVMVKNGCILLGHGTLKSQEWLDKLRANFSMLVMMQ